MNSSTNKVRVSFAELMHPEHTCRTIPYGTAIIASWVLKEFGHKIDADIFKYTTDFEEYLEKEPPRVACFSNYIWNLALSYEFARRIKKKSPETIIIFGGPNYPIVIKEHEMFLHEHPDIDYYIYREGENAIIELFDRLFEYDFNIAIIKKNRLRIPSCHYMIDGEIVQGDLSPVLANIEEIPSPYLSGLCDKLLDKELIPLIQTTVGCPFSCAFCQAGDKYFNQIRRFSSERIKDEVEYIAQRTSDPTLMLADANFGMYLEDVEVSKKITAVQDKYGWPKYFVGIEGKKNKERVMEVATIVKGSFLSAAVQSTNPQVLKNVRRQNVSLSQLIQVAKHSETAGTSSFSEVILCLPGDTKDAHFKTILDLIGAGIDIIRSHQLIMLPGSELAAKEKREQYNMITRFRITPGTVSFHQLFGEQFTAPEIDEICVANSTMPYDDYLECRLFNLTVEIFFNNGIFHELIKFLKLYNISSSSFIMKLHTRLRSTQNQLSDLYENFLRETSELWSSRKELEEFLEQPGVIDRYISRELGKNEQLVYRALAIFNHMDEMHKIAFDVAEELLTKEGYLDEKERHYLGELSEFSILRRKDMLSIGTTIDKIFHYDFVQLEEENFDDNPLSHSRPEGMNITFYRTNEQKELISRYIRVYGLSQDGLGNILGNASDVRNLYRKMNVT